jgi:hypothetical protein
MPTDLNILKKAFQNATATYESVSPGNEPLTRRESVQAEQVLGAPALPNDVGGWVASGGFPYQSTEYLASSSTYPIQTGAMPPARGYSETNPGAAGYPDVDFVPYNWGTNRFGNKGGALLGHPISWEVVGPTAKSPYLHWQWSVNGALNNTISLEPGATTVALTGGAGSVPTVEDAYNLSAGGITDYNGGLYVLVTLTGGEADSTGAGALLAPADPLTLNDPATSSFEVFRVKSYSGQDIVLESSKLLSGYFGVPVADPKVRAITIIRPKVTRLAAFPLSVLGAQRNQVYVFLPPETAARSELLPPYEGTGTCPDWSVNGIGTIVSDGSYGGDAPLPVPLPLYRLDGYIAGAGTVLNQMQVYVTLVGGQSITQGQIVRVTSHARVAVLVGKESHVFGYFEATNPLTASGTLDLRRVPEVNPATGEVFYGPGPGGGATDFVSVEVYDTISTVFTDPVLNVAKVAASRLDHLIDPRNAPYTFQRFSGTDSPVGTTTPPGASIFDTVTDSTNPGNLTGLGFRVVLFPAKEVLGDAVPDFDNPITSERVVLDPSLSATTVQTIEVDYAAGVLYLSHQPVPGPGCTVAPNGIVGTSGNNPRGEIVLFASCVPYSREETQRGGGIRVKATRPVSDLNPFGEHDAFDVYGRRCIADILTTVGAFTSGTALAISLPTNEIPPLTGWFYFVEVVSGSVTTVSDPNYYSYYNGLNPGVLYVSVAGNSYVITANTKVVFIKGPWNQVPATDLWYAGTTRGASKRADAVNFKGANVSLEADGSVTVQTVATLDEAYRAGDPFTPGAGRVIAVDGGAVEARPDAADNNDTFRSSFRVSVADVFGAMSLTGFDFKSDASATALADPYAGFSDRRVFAPTAASTTLTPSFTVDVTGDTVTAIGGNYFWSPGPYNRTLIQFGLDLIEIEGVTYVLSGYESPPVVGTRAVIRNLDGTAPVLALTGVTATVYRPRLFTGRGSTGTPADNLNTWVTAQEQSEAVAGQPYGALNLFANSSTALGAGDGGGSTAALAFWSRYNFLGVEVNATLNWHDTFGRFNSIMSTTFMTGGALPDYTYRGDYATRAVKDTIFPAAPAFGHIVEEYTDVEARYDYLSLVPLIPGGATYNATATNVLTGQVTVTSVLLANLIPYGSAIFELTSVNGNTTKRGLFLVTSGDGISVSPNTYFWLRDLNGTVGTLTLAPLLVFNGDTLTFRLHFSTSIGKRKDTRYLDPVLGTLLHTPSQSLGVGLETNAVGLSISAPVRYVGVPNEDRHAYRVTSATSGTVSNASNVETAALDVEGFHKANDYLYLASRTITKQINTQLFQPINTSGTQWEFDDVNGWWQDLGPGYSIKIPLDLPRSSDRTNSVGAKTHRTRLTYITVNGQFHGPGIVDEAIVRIYRVTFTGALPTRTRLYLGTGVLDYLLPFAGADTSTAITAWEDAAATLPVYIDNTTSIYYYIEVVSHTGLGNPDLLYGVQVTYTDPGPRNY